jgi:TetR/AcrR family transcriptional regulator, cholesterol catabolism regulator
LAITRTNRRRQKTSIAGVAMKRIPAPEKPDTRFDRKLEKVLEHATSVFYEKGYEGASMRDLSRESGMSLAGLYYYFQNKENLLFMIQRHTFRTVIDRLKIRLADVPDHEQRMRIFIANHLEYFLMNMKAMKVLSHEADVLKNEFGQEIKALKREYYRICLGLLQELKRERGVESTPAVADAATAPGRGAPVFAPADFVGRGIRVSNEDRTQVLSLFGMMNWIYTWHNPRTDADTGELARNMGEIFLSGVLGSALKVPATNGRSSRS